MRDTRIKIGDEKIKYSFSYPKVFGNLYPLLFVVVGCFVFVGFFVVGFIVGFVVGTSPPLGGVGTNDDKILRREMSDIKTNDPLLSQ